MVQTKIRKTRARKKPMVRIVLAQILGTLLLSFVLGSSSYLVTKFAYTDVDAAGEKLYSVRSGDSLWSIASSIDSSRTQEIVYWIQERNDLEDVTIYPGQTLILPEMGGEE